ncbi:hypothetical protein GIX45_25610 [Erwinia sp. CPCC 100877]|nr:hypothetical protein [Erwinia sp. CPCC 100877]
MIKKINFCLSLIIFLLLLFSATSILKGLDIKKALYNNTKEVHIIYAPNTNYKQFVSDIYESSLEHEVTISQYNFTAKDTLSIISTNPKINPFFRLKSGVFPTSSEDSYVTNYSDEDQKNIGLINLPSDFLKIKLYSFEQLKNIGIGNVFFIQGNGSKEKIINVFQKYGTVKLTEPVISDTFTVNVYQNLITVYLLIFFFVCIVSLAFSQRKIIALKKIMGYSVEQIVFQSTKATYSIVYGLIVALTVYIVLSRNITLNLVWSFLLCLFIYLLALIVYMSIIVCLYQLAKLTNTVKGAAPSKLLTIVLSGALCISLFLFLGKSQEIKQGVENYNQASQTTQLWAKTENLYKTNITNQLDREDPLEETTYLKNAQRFYEKISKKLTTFIIAPYNYTVLNDSNGKSIIIGQDRIPDKEEYITSPGGADITIDMNYLKVNPIEFITPSEKNQINADSYTLSLLVPQKYQKYEAKIIQNYLSDIKVRLTEEPPINKVSLDKVNIQVLYVENQQKYFTYNTFYGTEADENMIEDPIAVVVNPKLMDGLFWGNILTMNGGLFIDFDNAPKKEPFDLIKQDVKDSGLNGILNFTLSVFKERGEDMARNETNFFSLILQYSILIILFITLNIQITFILFKVNTKKRFVKEVLGYSAFNQMTDIVLIPMFIEIVTLVIFNFIHAKVSFVVVPPITIIVLNSFIYWCIQLNSKSISLKGDFYDI